MKKIILTGGGSAGHVTPNLALIDELLKDGWEVHYIGTKSGIERSIIKDKRIIYHAVNAGKL
ncbi:MAG TPA: UDP-N-acetylglucosamine--N-acetylmuramyl-(pentapeptide) pyrophosphoryl-undecaprenol N-acetylglucosamine transferase, partial [Clostridiaceae bacterium]|nr:UDP-N-acetylglucosamine--N-acetylmuramyl-(pentapeptide) pyrophosphoryl-undecaprenol N-acetylglucosamine transferase [Clostridiaceae bacterium]